MKDNYLFFNMLVIISLIISLSAPLANAWRHLYFLNFFIIYISAYFIMILSIILKKHIKKIDYSFVFFVNT